MQRRRNGQLVRRNRGTRGGIFAVIGCDLTDCDIIDVSLPTARDCDSFLRASNESHKARLLAYLVFCKNHHSIFIQEELPWQISIN